MGDDIMQEHEALLQFLYLAPVGLAQTRLDGEILMVNPLCAQLLLPLARDGALDNLFTALQDVAPDLAQRVAGVATSHGMVCEAMPLPVGAAGAGAGAGAAAQWLSLSLLKLDAQRLMVVLADVSQMVRHARALQRSQAWLDTIAGSGSDDALAPLHAPTDLRPALRAYSPILRDIGERSEAQEPLPPALLCDQLTGLANRLAFFEAAELALLRWRRQPQPLSLLAVDADHFRRIHQRHGHAAADAVLRHLASGLATSFPAPDLVARSGGQAFCVLLPGSDAAAALAAAQRLCRSLAAQPVMVDGVPIPCTVSAGVASMHTGLAGLDALLQHADLALRAAKAGGRNRVAAWSPGLHQGSDDLAPAR